MSKKIQRQLEMVSTTVSKISGLYGKWAHGSDVKPCVLLIMYILHTKGPLTQKRICETCMIPKQTVNKGITELKRNGRITLKEGDMDKREKTIVLTKSGEKYARELLTPLIELEEKVVLRMGRDLLGNLCVAMKAFSDAMELEMELEQVASRWKKRHQ